MLSKFMTKHLPKCSIARAYRIKKGIRKVKEKTLKNAASDDKMIKLTKKEDIEAKERREVRF